MYYFIFNPIAGKSHLTTKVINDINSSFANTNIKYEIIHTKYPGNASEIVSDICKNTQEKVYFFACGGDGTSFEVLNGMADYPNAHFGVIPIGSCNDFNRNFEGLDFLNMKNYINPDIINVDLLKANNIYALNAINIGLDANINDDCNKNKKLAKNIKVAYNKAIFKNFFKSFKNQMKIISDGEVIHDGQTLLSVVANGKAYGGGYICAPKSEIDNGFIELVIIKKVTRLKFITLIKKYKAGTMKPEKFKKIYSILKCKKVTFESPVPIKICFDGEVYEHTKLDVEIQPGKLKFIKPSKNSD